MRAITLWQPWASLIAEGVKWIETRPKRAPWSAAIGETIAIHASAKWPDKHYYFPPLCPAGCWRDEENCPGHIMECPTITDPAHQRPHISARTSPGRARAAVNAIQSRGHRRHRRSSGRSAVRSEGLRRRTASGRPATRRLAWWWRPADSPTSSR